VRRWEKIAVISVAIVLCGLGGFRYRHDHRGYHGECVQSVAVDVSYLPSDMTGIAAWQRQPFDGYQYYSSDCSDESRAN
jgi:hypothetical protein